MDYRIEKDTMGEVKVLAKNPILIERPSSGEKGKKTLIGRPPENVLKII